MKTRILIITGLSVVVFLMGVVVYPYINETTFEDYSSHDIKSALDVSEPRIFTTSPKRCAELFDQIFDTWRQHVDENYGGPGQPTLEPPTVAGLISGWRGGEEFRNTDCRFSVDNWGYLVENQEQVWGNVDWPKLESFQ